MPFIHNRKADCHESPIRPLESPAQRGAAHTRNALAALPWLKPLAGRLLDPQLWRPQHEAVARGVTVGTFWCLRPAICTDGGGAALGYVSVKLIWRLRIWLKRRTRRAAA
ncbi:MAG: hypothetical protein RI925_1060 [Pseudomonadota bacterium]|jgi:hypothetical protein